jgi:hypothetical protein
MKKSHPLKQLLPTMLDNAGAYHKVKKGIPRVLGAMASLFAGGSIFRGVKTGVGLAKYPSYLPKGWNKGGSKETFKHLKGNFGPSKESVDYLLKYSKDFGPIIKKMKK